MYTCPCICPVYSLIMRASGLVAPPAPSLLNGGSDFTLCPALRAPSMALFLTSGFSTITTTTATTATPRMIPMAMPACCPGVAPTLVGGFGGGAGVGRGTEATGGLVG